MPNSILSDAQRGHLISQAEEWIDCGLAMGGRWADQFPARLGAVDAIPVSGLMALTALEVSATTDPDERSSRDYIAVEVLRAEVFALPADVDLLTAPSMPDLAPCPHGRLVIFEGPLAPAKWIPDQLLDANMTGVAGILFLPNDQGVAWLWLSQAGEGSGLAWMTGADDRWQELRALDRLRGVLDWGRWTTAPRPPKNIRRRMRRWAPAGPQEIPPVHVIELGAPGERLVVDRPEFGGRTPAGHTRRAHWHRYRVGVDVHRDENRGVTWDYRLCWLPATTVLGGPEDDRPTVYRLPTPTKDQKDAP